MVDGEELRSDRGGDDLLHGEAGEVGALRAAGVGVLPGDEDRAGDVGAGLVSVEGDGAPPLRDGRGGSGAAIGGGDGEEEVLDEELVGGSPPVVPDEVDVHRGGKDEAHVVAKVDQVGGALKFLGGGEGLRGKLWVEVGVRLCLGESAA